MKVTYNKLVKSHNKYITAISEMESNLSDKLEFDNYTIFYQQSDGLVIEWEANNAPLDLCLEVISKKGFLSMEDYLNLTI
jgi:hypothetical protein